jgi:isoleucyl-tRNA synthetase
MVELRVNSKEGFNASHEGNNFMILNTTLTDELIKEGIVRELISKVQNLRKERDFEITDRIVLYISSDENILSIVDEYKDMIQNEVLALEIITKENLEYEVDLNGNKAFIDVEVK